MLYATHALVRICYIGLYSVDIEEEKSIVKSFLRIVAGLTNRILSINK